MTVEAPPKDQDGIRRPFFDLLHQARINYPVKMMRTRVGGGIFDKAIIISFQHGHIPFDMSAKTRVILGALLRLLPCIKHLDLTPVVASQQLEQGNIVLNGMRSNDG